MNDLLNRLCECGHMRRSHAWLDEVWPNSHLPHVMGCGSCKAIYDNLHEFKQDNLRFLEEQYEQHQKAF